MSQMHLKVSTWKAQAIGGIGAVFFSFCAIMSWRYGHGSASLWFIPFVLLPVPILLLTGPITASREALSLSTPVGRFEILWNEIDRIEHGQSSMVFFSGQKRLSIPTSNWWAGPEKKNLLAAIESVTRGRQIEMKETFRADYLFHKHTRVA